MTVLTPLLQGLSVLLNANTLLTESPQTDLPACKLQMYRHSGVCYDSLNFQFWLFREPRTRLSSPCPRSLTVMGRKALRLKTQSSSVCFPVSDVLGLCWLIGESAEGSVLQLKSRLLREWSISAWESFHLGQLLETRLVVANGGG